MYFVLVCIIAISVDVDETVPLLAVDVGYSYKLIAVFILTNQLKSVQHDLSKRASRKNVLI